MRKFILITVLLWAAAVWAAPTFVQGTIGNNPTSSLAFSSNAAHDTLVVFVEAIAASGFTTITDGAGNQYHLVNASPQLTGGIVLYAFVVEDCKASAGTNTVSINGSSGTRRMAIMEWSGVGNVRPVRSVSIGSSGSSATPATSAMTTVSGDLIIGAAVINSAGTWTAGAGYTLRLNTTALAVEDAVASSTSATVGFTYSASAAWVTAGVILSASIPVTSDTGIVQWDGGMVFLASTVTATLPAVTAGNRLTAGVWTTVTGVTISASDGTNTWTCRNATNGGTATDTMAYCFAENVASGSTTVTFSWDGTNHTAYAVVVENAASGSGNLRYDVSSATNAGSPAVVPPVPTAVNDVVFGCTDLDSTSNSLYSGPTGDANFLGNNASGGYRFGCYEVLGSAASAAPSARFGTNNNNVKYNAGTFKTATSGFTRFIQGRSCAVLPCAFPNNLGASHLVTVAMQATSASTCDLAWISDTASLSWSVSAAVRNGTSNRTTCIYHAISTAGADSISISTGTGPIIGITEWRGYENTVAATTSTTTTTPQTFPPVSVTANSSLMLVSSSGDSISSCTPSDATLLKQPLGWSYANVNIGTLNESCDNGGAGSLVIFAPTPGAIRHGVIQ